MKPAHGLIFDGWGRGTACPCVIVSGPPRRSGQTVDHETDLSSIEPDVGQQTVVEALEVANRQSTVAPGPKPPERFQDRAED